MKTIDMTEGPLKKQILFFSLPLIASNLLQVLFNLADVAVVGRFAGAASLGSVGSTTILVCLFTGLTIGLGSGVNAVAALFMGAKSDRDVERTVHTSLILSLAAGFLLWLLGAVFAKAMLSALNTKDILFDGAALYLKIYFISMPASALFNFGNGVYSAVGNTRKPLIYLTISGVVNVILNLFFVISLGMDVDGVAWASVISMYISAVLIIISLFKENNCYALDIKKLCFDTEKARRVLAIGIPSALQNAIFQFANLFIQAAVNSFDAVMVEGNSAATNADSIVYNTMSAFYVACTSFMSQNYGARNKERIIKSFRISTAYSFIVGMALGLGILALGHPFLGLFTTEEAVIEAGMQRLLIMGLSYGWSAFMDSTIAASRGLSRTAVPTFIVIMGSCVFRIIWVYTIFAAFHTIQSLYLLYIFSWSLTAAAEIIYFNHAWKQVCRELN